MRSRKAFWGAVFALAALAVLFGLIVPSWRKPALTKADEAGPPPASYTLRGIVRDFRAGHGDFPAVAAQGSGHAASNVMLWLPGDNHPAFLETGYLVEAQWHDSKARPIAPHLYNSFPPGSGGETLGIRVNDKIKIEDDVRIDAFNSHRGPYGLNGNYGHGAYVSTNSAAKKAIDVDNKARIYGDVYVGPGGTPGQGIDDKAIVTGRKGVLTEPYPMPDIDAPDEAALGAPLGDVEIKRTTVTLRGDMDLEDEVGVPALNYRELTIKEFAVVQVEGELTIVCQRLKIENNSQIVLAEGASLTLYVTDDHDVKIEKSSLNLPGAAEASTTALVINYLGRKHMHVKESHLYATIMAPHGELELDHAQVFGAFVGDKLKLKHKDSAFHVDIITASMSPRNFAITVDDKIEVEDFGHVDSFNSNNGPYNGPDQEGTNFGTDARLMTNQVKKDKVKIKKHSIVDGDVLVGPGGNVNQVIKVEDHSQLRGTRGTLTEMRPIPFATPPVTGPRQNELKYKNGTFTLTGDVRCKHMHMEKAILEIAGDVTLRVDDHIEIKKDSHIRLLEGARLEIYFGDDLKVEERSSINDGGNPQRVWLRHIDLEHHGHIEIKKDSRVVAWSHGHRSELKIEERSEYFGSFAGKKVKVKKSSKLHVDMAFLNDCVQINDTPGVAAGPNHGGITSNETFAQWFRDLPGVNQSAIHAITLTRNGSGVYEYLDDAFSPIDGRLLGNGGDSHNRNFTYTVAAEFLYEECEGQFIEFQGGDGAWVYVNGNLVIDLGGVDPQSPQFIEIDRLGLAGGQTYPVHLFYAQRSGSDRPFKLRTNIVLNTDRLPSITLQYD